MMKRRDLRFADLSEVVAEVHKLKENGYTQAGNWDLGTMCDHLNKTMHMVIHGFDFKYPYLLVVATRWLLLKKVLRCDPVGFKATNPKSLTPSEDVDEEKVIAEFEDYVAQLASSEVALIEDHPVFGKITRPQCVKVQIWHAAHHLSFLIPNKE